MRALSLAQRLNVRKGKKILSSAYSIRDILAGQDRRRNPVIQHKPAWQLTLSFTSELESS